MAESPVPAELAQTVDSEIAAAQCFLAFLEREQQMLVKGEVDDLLDLVRQKNKVAAELATLAARRSRLLAASGVASDGAGIAAWFAAHPEETGTRDAWSSLLAVIAAELATLAARRSRLLAASGVASDGAGIAAWFAAHPEETGTRDAWSSLLAVAAQARELNRVNGELIQERLQSNAQALEVLLGSNAAAGNLYGPDGQSAPPSTRRISDSA